MSKSSIHCCAALQTQTKFSFPKQLIAHFLSYLSTDKKIGQSSDDGKGRSNGNCAALICEFFSVALKQQRLSLSIMKK